MWWRLATSPYFRRKGGSMGEAARSTGATPSKSVLSDFTRLARRGVIRFAMVRVAYVSREAGSS